MVFKSSVFLAEMTKQNSDEERKIQRCKNHGNITPSGERCACCWSVLRTWE